MTEDDKVVIAVLRREFELDRITRDRMHHENRTDREEDRADLKEIKRQVTATNGTVGNHGARITALEAVKPGVSMSLLRVLAAVFIGGIATMYAVGKLLGKW